MCRNTIRKSKTALIIFVKVILYFHFGKLNCNYLNCHFTLEIMSKGMFSVLSLSSRGMIYFHGRQL